MTQKLRILIVEDSENDALLLLREVQRGGYEVEIERVETAREMRSALDDQAWDVIICDYSLPQFGAQAALDILKASGQDLPFIIVSGTIGEQRAVASLKQGAHDFVIKTNLARLVPAVERELRDAAVRQERRQAEQQLRATQARLSGILRIAADAIIVINERHQIELFNQGAERLFGYSADEMVGQSLDVLLPLGLADKHRQHVQDFAAASENVRYAEHRSNIFGRRKDGTEFPAEASISRLEEDGRRTFIVILRDITERMRVEQVIKQRDQELQQRNIELTRLYRASEALLVGSMADLPSLASTIVQTVLREFEHSNCSLFLVKTEARKLQRLAVEGPYAAEVAGAQLSLDEPGLVAKAIRTGEVLNVPDVSTDPDYVPNWKLARSELVIPLKIGDDVIGALDVQSPEASAFHADDERLMTIFGERTALALERARLHQQTQKQLKQLEGLRTIDLAISNSFDLRLSLNIVLEQVILQLGVDAASVLLLNQGLARLEYASGKGFRTHEIENSNLRLGEGHAGKAALEKEILYIENVQVVEEPLVRRQLLTAEEFVTYFAVPLTAKGEIKGVLEVFHRTALHPEAEWLNFLDALSWQTAIAVDNALLFEGIQRSNFELALAYDATIEGWSRALDLRDRETEGHTRRVTDMTIKFAQIMGFREEQLVHLRRGALLHDIGKMGVPDTILLKADKLTDEEWRIMKEHPQLAYDLLAPIAYLKEALDIPYCHHEWWDGSGYPRGLSGTQIPLEARLFAIVDVWDAITSDRPYRKKWPRSKALKYIREQSGKQFDPDAVDVFLREIIK